MELAPSRCRRARTTRTGLTLAAVLAGWLSLVVLVPVILGLGTVAIDGREAARTGLSEGSVLVTRDVPVSDLRVGDEIRVDGALLRVSGTSPGALQARPVVGGGPERTVDDVAAVPRVALTVPYAGLPLIGTAGLVLWLLAGVLAALTVQLLRPHRLAAVLRSRGAGREHGLSIG